MSLKDELIDTLNGIYSRIILSRGINEKDYKLMAVGPIACAVRVLFKYGIDKLSGDEKKITILAAAKISYASFSLGDNIAFDPSTNNWLGYLSVFGSEANSKLFDEITIKLLAKHDMCINERQKYEPWLQKSSLFASKPQIGKKG